MSFEIEGKENLEQLFKQLPQAYSRKAMLSIFRKAALPVNRSLRSRLPGSLKKSVGTLSGKSRTNPTLYAGVLFKKKNIEAWFKTYWKAYGTLANRDPSHNFSYGRKSKSADFEGGIKPDKSLQSAVSGSLENANRQIVKHAAAVTRKTMSNYAKVKGRES